MQSLGETDPGSVGGYPLFARLGAGGMGQVYLARTPAGRPLALKTMRTEFALDPAFGERFAREIRHADRVRSPWTVTVVDHAAPGARPQWLATEYVAAPSLTDWVAGHGPLPDRSLTALAAELCRALDAVHQAGLSHRDVKPSNVLLGGDRPLLIDFGIARAADDTRHTRTGGVVGSPGYMAPEQATAGGSAEPGDVFALGAVLVFAATGRGPFDRLGEHPSTPALLYRVVHEDPDLDGVPPALLPLVRACLAKEPGDRPTAPAAAGLLAAPGRSPERWALCHPPGLEAELAAREADMRTAFESAEAVATPMGQFPPVPTPHAALADSPAVTAASAPPALPAAPREAGTGGAFGGRSGVAAGSGAPGEDATGPQAVRQDATGLLSSRSPYTGTPPPRHDHPAYRGGPRVLPPAGAHPAVVPRPAAPPSAPASAPASRALGAPLRPAVRPRAVPIAVGVLALLAVAGPAVYLVVNSRSGQGSSAGGASGTTPPVSTAGSGQDALPASWQGVWAGAGPGSETGAFTVTLTLRAGHVGQVVGQQVTHVRDPATGADDGCTESLELASAGGDTMTFAARDPHTTDPASVLSCAAGHVYRVSLADGVLRLGAGSQASGSPTTFRRVSRQR